MHVSPPARGAHKHDHHCETVWSETHHWRQRLQCLRSHLCVSPTLDGIAYDPKSIWDTWRDAKTESPQLEICLQCSELTASSKIGGISLCADEKPRCNDCPWPFRPNVCLLVLWLDSSDIHTSADVADQCFACVPKFCWCILAAHLYRKFLPLITENSPQQTILQYAPVFALANYAARWPQRMIENAKWFSQKYTHYWTVNLLDRLYPKWQQLGWLPVQSVPMLYCRDWSAFTIQSVR